MSKTAVKPTVSDIIIMIDDELEHIAWCYNIDKSKAVAIDKLRKMIDKISVKLKPLEEKEGL